MNNHGQGQWFSMGYLVAFWSGIVMGGVVGAGAMLLLAPQSGKKMRSQIQQEGQALRNEVAHSVETVVEQARGKAHRISEGVHKEVEHLEAHAK
jgi:gas vesicle protein